MMFIIQIIGNKFRSFWTSSDHHNIFKPLITCSTRQFHAVWDYMTRVRFQTVSLEFLSPKSFRPHYGPGVDSDFNRNKYQEYFLCGKGGRCLGVTTLPPSCADFLEIWEPQLPGNLRACPGL